MLGFRFVKVPPTTYVIQFRSGKVVRAGAGLSFLYFAPNSLLVQVPMASADVPFVFNEVSADFQDMTIQGELTYRISDPKRTATLLDFSLDARGRYRSNDLEKLSDRLVHAAQIFARSFTQRHALAELLISSDTLVQETIEKLKASETATMLGVEVLALSITSIKTAPEMAKALQADAREQLLQKADEAVFVRRNAALELERRIKESELNTEIAVEQKKRQVRETQMEADVAIEQQRSQLVEHRVENQRKEAEARGQALRATLEPLKDMDWRTLMAAAAGEINPKLLVAMAFRDLAENAARIGQLNVSPDLLNALLASDGKQ